MVQVVCELKKVGNPPGYVRSRHTLPESIGQEGTKVALATGSTNCADFSKSSLEKIQ